MDVAILAILLASFGLLVTTHVAVSVQLLFRVPWWRGLASLFVPPFAPYFAYKAQLKVGATLWLTWAFVYAIALIAALSI